MYIIHVNGFSIDTSSRWKKKDGFIRTCLHDFMYLLSAGSFRGSFCQLGLWHRGSGMWRRVLPKLCVGFDLWRSVCRAAVPRASPECSSAKMPSCSIFTRQEHWPWRFTTRPSICWRQTLNSSGNTFGTEPFSPRFVPVILVYSNPRLERAGSAHCLGSSIFLTGAWGGGAGNWKLLHSRMKIII